MLDRILTNLKQVEAIILGEKSQFCMAALKIVGYLCDRDGWHLDFVKVAKILN